MQWISLNKREDKCKWHFWFAWYPVTVKEYSDGSKKRAWWEWVFRCFYIDWIGYEINAPHEIKVPIYKEIK